MSAYAIIDPQIREWVDRHALKLGTHWAGGETRNVYVSSIAGECFQIWVDPPESDRVCIHAAGVEGRKDNDTPQDWWVPIASIGAGLETAWDTVIEWMAPSERYNPPAA